MVLQICLYICDGTCWRFVSSVLAAALRWAQPPEELNWEFLLGAASILGSRGRRGAPLCRREKAVLFLHCL